MKHLRDRGEGYFEHMFAALRLSLLLSTMSLKCVVHALVPCFFEKAVSEKIDCLKDLTNR